MLCGKFWIFRMLKKVFFGKYESQHRNQDHPDLTERYVMENVMENVKIDIPPPDPVINEYIPSAAIENIHNNPEPEPPRNSLNPVVPLVVQQTDFNQNTKAVVKKPNDSTKTLEIQW